jgi:hypothetical protein
MFSIELRSSDELKGTSHRDFLMALNLTPRNHPVDIILERYANIVFKPYDVPGS